MPRWIWIAIAAALLGLAWFGRSPSTGTSPQALPGGAAVICRMPEPVVAGEAPRQSDVPSDMRAFRIADFTVTPLAGFSLDARVLSREDYSRGIEAELSPTDLALGWQQMSEPENYEPLDISQSGRWYQYRWGSEGPPMPASEIARSSANMHMIPADAAVAAALERVEAGQRVRIDGWLVAVRRDDGWQWRSSLTRNDTGGGACELVYVCALEAR